MLQSDKLHVVLKDQTFWWKNNKMCENILLICSVSEYLHQLSTYLQFVNRKHNQAADMFLMKHISICSFIVQKKNLQETGLCSDTKVTTE